MKLGDLLNKLADKISLQQDENFQSFIANSAINSIDIDDALAGSFDTGLMSLDGAKNNTTVLNHFKPILLKSLDDQFAVLAEKYGIADEIGAEKSTYKKVGILESKLASKIADLEARAAGKGGDADKLTKEIAHLQAELQNLATSKDKEIADLKDGFAKQILSSLVDAELKGKNYANAELGETNVVVARTLLDKAIAEKKITLINDNGKIRMKSAENPTLDYYDESHKQVGFADFVDKMLAEKHLLAVSETGKPSQHTAPPVGTAGAKTSSIDAAVQASIEDLN